MWEDHMSVSCSIVATGLIIVSSEYVVHILTPVKGEYSKIDQTSQRRVFRRSEWGRSGTLVILIAELFNHEKHEKQSRECVVHKMPGRDSPESQRSSKSSRVQPFLSTFADLKRPV